MAKLDTITGTILPYHFASHCHSLIVLVVVVIVVVVVVLRAKRFAFVVFSLCSRKESISALVMKFCLQFTINAKLEVRPSSPTALSGGQSLLCLTTRIIVSIVEQYQMHAAEQLIS